MTRFGQWAHFTNIKIADDTGSIHLNLWNKQLQNHDVGDPIEIKNGHVARYRGELQLRLGRKGTIN
jgi:ssDNA-binding replication factor A large subunit